MTTYAGPTTGPPCKGYRGVPGGTHTFLKRVSGTYNWVYIGRGALYTKMTHSFIYFETMLDIEEKH